MQISGRKLIQAISSASEESRTGIRKDIGVTEGKNEVEK